MSRPWRQSQLGFIGDRTLFSVRYDLRLKKSYIERTTDGRTPKDKINAWYVLRMKQVPLNGPWDCAWMLCNVTGTCVVVTLTLKKRVREGGLHSLD